VHDNRDAAVVMARRASKRVDSIRSSASLWGWSLRVVGGKALSLSQISPPARRLPIFCQTFFASEVAAYRETDV